MSVYTEYGNYAFGARSRILQGLSNDYMINTCAFFFSMKGRVVAENRENADIIASPL